MNETTRYGNCNHHCWKARQLYAVNLILRLMSKEMPNEFNLKTYTFMKRKISINLYSSDNKKNSLLVI